MFRPNQIFHGRPGQVIFWPEWYTFNRFLPFFQGRTVQVPGRSGQIHGRTGQIF